MGLARSVKRLAGAGALVHEVAQGMEAKRLDGHGQRSNDLLLFVAEEQRSQQRT